MTINLTYKELSERLNIKLSSARRLVMRKKWIRLKGNDGETRISIPENFFDSRNDMHNDNHDDAHDDKKDNEIRVLSERIEGLERLAASEKMRADAAEKDRDRWYEEAKKSIWKKLFS
ncbi:hypothetical protein [Brucella pseudogrignonensis]|uniref:DNA-binding protein n=1 Tax=Brucella pseudogrignonensis TaxID=419475 RepID=A0ABU1MFP0_9HYPH|nr:hypothetical protein [Brucella pseudogrignonensis]MDR6434865.1 hypothetical protein [Brucella pseudogrignonensis]